MSTRVLQPDGAEPVWAGDVYSVSWEAPLLTTQVKLQYSMGNGTTWKPMRNGLVGGRSYDWRVPVPPNNKRSCLMKITGQDQHGEKIGKGVSAPFMIEVASITAPIRDDIVPRGFATYAVTWMTHGISEDVSSATVFYTLGNSGICKKAAGTLVDPLTRFNWNAPSPANPI